MMLVVVRRNVVIEAVRQIVSAEQSLRRIDPLRPLLRCRQVPVGREIADNVGSAELDAIVVAPRVVEGREENGGAELAIVEEVCRLLPVDIEPYLESGDND